jgi:hypothetical protein
LQEDWVVLGRHEQRDGAKGADAAHADGLDREIGELVPIGKAFRDSTISAKVQQVAQFSS